MMELAKFFWKEKTFWSDGYFLCSIGNVSKETIEKYIQNQGQGLHPLPYKDSGFTPVFINKQIYKLSGGEKKVVAIAGIIVMSPEIILMDEVTSSLDPKSRRTVINLIKDLKETIVIASHDLDMVLEVCDRVLVFNNGEIIQEGPAYPILSNKKIMEESNLELPLSLIKNKFIKKC